MYQVESTVNEALQTNKDGIIRFNRVTGRSYAVLAVTC